MDIETIREIITGGGIGLMDIIAILSFIAALTPTPVDNAILRAIREAINVGAINVGNAKPEQKPKQRAK